MHTSSRAMPAVAGILLLLSASWAVAQESATAEEVIEKTREAAEYLAKNKEAGIEAFKTARSRHSSGRATATCSYSTAPQERTSPIRTDRRQPG